MCIMFLIRKTRILWGFLSSNVHTHKLQVSEYDSQISHKGAMTLNKVLNIGFFLPFLVKSSGIVFCMAERLL